MKDLWSNRVLGVVERRELCLPLESDINRYFQPLFRFSAARPALGIGYHHLDRERGISGRRRIEMEERPTQCSVTRKASLNPLDLVAPNLETDHGQR